MKASWTRGSMMSSPSGMSQGPMSRIRIDSGASWPSPVTAIPTTAWSMHDGARCIRPAVQILKVR